jgi:hypothetical protein
MVQLACEKWMHAAQEEMENGNLLVAVLSWSQVVLADAFAVPMDQTAHTETFQPLETVDAQIERHE